MLQAFAYRDQRLSATMPIEFATAGGTLFGVTSDVSPGGFTVRFDEPVLPGTAGQVRIRIGHCILEIGAAVGHACGFDVGLVLNFASESERETLRVILQAVAAAKTA